MKRMKRTKRNETAESIDNKKIKPDCLSENETQNETKQLKRNGMKRKMKRIVLPKTLMFKIM